MTRLKTAALGMSSILLLQGCVTTPFGPTVAIVPAQGKPFEVFAQDQAFCQQYAANQVQGQADRANTLGVGTAILGTVLGAGLGAAIGGGGGAAIGAGGGALLGTGIGTDGGGHAQVGIQVQYNNNYAQCMLAKGNTLPGSPPVVVQPAPYVVQPSPYVVQPGVSYQPGAGYPPGGPGQYGGYPPGNGYAPGGPGQPGGSY